MFDQPTATSDARHDRFFARIGDARQVWALDTTTGRVVHLAAGGVDDDVRRGCREQRLRCPIPDCPDPRLIAKGGSQRRHHFAHKIAHTAHDDDAIFRSEATAMLAGWARRYRGAQVSTHDDDALGVLTIRSAFSGRQIELAITYDRSYHDIEHHAGPDTQLLIGHTRALLLPRAPISSSPGAWWCGASRLVGDIIEQRGAALAVNPQLQLAATLVPTGDAKRAGLLARSAGTEHPTVCFMSQLSACSLTADGMTTPHLAALDAWRSKDPERRAPLTPRTRRRRSAATDDATLAHASLPDDRPASPRSARRRRRSSAGARAVHINRVLLTARLAADPERRMLPDGTRVCALRITCNAKAGPKPRRGMPDGHQEMTVIAADATAPAQLATGHRVAIDGHLECAPQPLDGSDGQELRILAQYIEQLADHT